MDRPVIAGPWQLLYAPTQHGNYVNDHTILRAADGSWHLIGITSFGGGPTNERYFTHGMGSSLREPMTEVNRVVDTGYLAWAPAAIQHEDLYYLYFGPSPSRMAVSVDLNEWMVSNLELVGAPLMACHRDHMVMKLNDYTWLMYATGLHKGKGCISVFVSNDLQSWRFVQYALTSGKDAPLNPPWGAFESPYVVRYGKGFYLFTTYTDCRKENYHNTLAFYSENPYDFGQYSPDESGCTVAARLPVHAGEVLRDTDGQYYITTCGWRNFDIPHEGGVSIAPLRWEP